MGRISDLGEHAKPCSFKCRLGTVDELVVMQKPTFRLKCMSLTAYSYSMRKHKWSHHALDCVGNAIEVENGNEEGP